jgi:diamine N-acetyltransferase
MPRLSIAPATIHDIPHIQAVASAAWPVTYGTILSSDQIAYMLRTMYDADALRQQMEEAGHMFLLAQLGERVVGFISYTTDRSVDHDSGRVAKIHKLYVHPDAQGAGVGRGLMDNVRTVACAAGCQMLTLNVNRYNSAVRFYERYGFVGARLEDVDFGSGYFMNDVVMELQLGK